MFSCSITFFVSLNVCIFFLPHLIEDEMGVEMGGGKNLVLNFQAGVDSLMMKQQRREERTWTRTDDLM